MIRFNAQPVTLDAAAAEDAPRTITGIAVPWDVAATVSDGTPVKFLRGSFDVNAKPAKLIENHDMTQLRGTVTELVDGEDALYFSARFAKTQAADEAIELVKAGAYDAVSVGATPVRFKYDKDGVMVVSEARLLELSLVPYGAFEEAVITEIAASEEIPADAPEASNNPEQAPQGDTPNMEATPAAVDAVEATIPTAPLPAQPKREFKMPSAAEYLTAMHIGGDTFAKINAAYREAAAAKRSVIEAAAGDIDTGSTPGLLPVPVLGPLVQDLNFVRPVVQAVGARAYPDGGATKTFVRPTITTHTAVGTQAAELNAVTAQTMVIAANSVSKTTVAGQVTFSAQDIDFTNPAAMQLVLNDLMGEYMIATDNIAADNLLSNANASGVWDGTPEDLVKSIYDAAVDISSGRNWFPTHMFVSPDVWGQLGQVVDSSKRPLFPFVGAGLTGQNALGNSQATSWNGNPLGLQLVVDSNFAAKTMIITRVGTGQGDAYEFYEQIRGLMSVEVPATLGRTFSYYGYVSTFAAIGGMIRKITQA